MSLPRDLGDQTRPPLTWEDLVMGAPTIIGFAALCSRALAADPPLPEVTSPAAGAILHAARQRGALEIKPVKSAYDSSQRLLAVHVELAPARWLVFRSRQRPQYTIELLEGFRQLCLQGLVMHHQGAEFALSHAGMQLAPEEVAEEIRCLLAEAVELEFDD
jgi:hypothetical protein